MEKNIVMMMVLIYLLKVASKYIKNGSNTKYNHKNYIDEFYNDNMLKGKYYINKIRIWSWIFILNKKIWMKKNMINSKI